MAKLYRWTSAKPLARGNPSLQNGLLLPGPQSQENFVREGQVFEPTSAELKAFSDKIERIREGE